LNTQSFYGRIIRDIRPVVTMKAQEAKIRDVPAALSVMR